jgi:sugar phosphate isomerase/epimerase
MRGIRAIEATGDPKNDALVPYLNSAIESFKEMADYGGEKGVKVTIENHWGLAADPANIRIILDTVTIRIVRSPRTSATGSTNTCCSAG